MNYQLVSRQHSQRRQVEQFICERYWSSFQACLIALPDMLLAVFDDDALIAACGLQFAEDRPLFSEYYLDQALTDYQVAGQRLPERNKIAEIGSMAARSADDLKPLFAAIVEITTQLNRTLVIFTATGYLQRTLRRSGVVLSELAPAHETALPNELQGIWGDYYRHHPKVLGGWLAQGFGRFIQTTEAIAC